ncbi:Imm10 family immunity protein [Streptomyces sp. NPDC088196]|uniref:Imm10 family immunity protein n=1 Tax=Streptomyces sp. NPDC088196 TaxID=3154868 RepID=UPI00344BBC35
MSFTVRRAGVEHYPLDDDDAYSFGIDDGSASGRSVLFMCMENEEIEEGADLEMYCLSLENGRSYYGGIQRIDISRERLRVELDDEAVEVLRADPSPWDLALDISDEVYEELKAGLRRVFSVGEGPELVGF